MNNNITLDRIRRQIQKPAIVLSQVNRAVDAAKATIIDDALDVDELRAILIEELGVEHEVAQVVVIERDISEIRFNNIYEFVPWYVEHKTDFTPAQVKALDTLEEAMAMIGKGCACRRAVRERIANEYFTEFWTKNKETDLLPTIAKASQVLRVVVVNICSYPASTP